MVEGALLVAFKNIGSSWKQIKTVLQEMPPRAGSEGFYAGNRHAPRLIQPAGLVGRNTGGGNGYMKTVQNASGLFMPCLGTIQRAQGVLPKDVLCSSAVKEAILAVLCIPQLYRQRLQGKRRSEGTDIRIHQAAGYIRRIHVRNDL